MGGRIATRNQRWPATGFRKQMLKRSGRGQEVDAKIAQENSKDMRAKC